MRPADVEPAAAAIRLDDFGDRRAWFEFATSYAGCHPFVADLDDRIVGTGVGTRNGPVGWIGAIWVASDRRGHGIGRALTEAVISALVDGGVRSLVLVASEDGRRLYERMGFELQTWYDTFEAPGTPDVAPPSEVRPFRRADLEAMASLDRVATGEDRAAILRRFARAGTARVVERDGAVAGFVVRAPWGGAATAAPEPEDALRLLAARRAAAPSDHLIRAAIPREHEAGRAALIRSGFRPAWSAPRLVRGQPIRWQPEQLWGQFNMAMG